VVALIDTDFKGAVSVVNVCTIDEKLNFLDTAV